MILIERWEESPILAAARGPYNEAVVAQFKSIPGLRWDAECRYWCGDAVGLDAALAVCEEARLAKIVRLAPARMLKALPAERSFDARLLPYQLQGAQWLCDQLALRGAALLADDMGLGKTPQAIAAVEATLSEFDSCIVVAPAIVVPHWRREIEKWVQPNEYVPCRYHIYSYEDFQAALKLQGTEPKKRPGKLPLQPLPHSPSAIIFDEAHYISNAKANRAAALREFCRKHPSMLRIALTGTPISSKVKQFHNILDILYPGAFGTWFKFTKRYCDGHHDEIMGRGGEKIQAWNPNGSSNLEELQARLAAFMLRRTKSDVALQLPERRRILLDVQLPAKVRKQLQKAQEALRLLQGEIAASASSLLSGVEEHKIPAAVELAQELQQQGRKVLLLTTRIASAESIAAQLGCAIATGSTEPAERMRILQAASCAVSTIYAVTTGINLTNYDTIIFVGLDWVPSTLLQAEARIHRIGQSSSCLIYYLVGEGSIDEIVRSKVLNRLEIFEKALGSEDSGLRSDLGYAREGILQAFAEKLSKQLGEKL